jgi:hypothetical protein
MHSGLDLHGDTSPSIYDYEHNVQFYMRGLQWDDAPASPAWSDDLPKHADHASEEETLSARYAKMQVDKEETTIFDVHTSLDLDRHESELCRVVATAFSACLGDRAEGDARGSRQLIQEVQEHSNYALEQVVRVMNKAQHKMHKAVAER